MSTKSNDQAKDLPPEPAGTPPDFSRPIKVAELPKASEYRFDLEFSDQDLRIIAEILCVPRVKKVGFKGKLMPFGRRDWELEAKIGATVTQECVITLDPVTTRIDQNIRRRFLADLEPGAADSVVEMDGDDETDRLEPILDLGHIALESIALYLPMFPKKPGATLEKAQFSEPGTAAMTDDDAKPFASLAALKDKLNK